MKTKVSKTLIAVIILMTAASFINFSTPQKAYAIDALVPPCEDIEGLGREVLVGGIPNSGVVNFEPEYEPLPEHTACVRDQAASDSKYQLEGWVWDTNLGWISLYCPAGVSAMNQGIPCSGTYEGGYGVYVDALTYELRGYAWGDNTGWISFNCLDDELGCTATNTHRVIVESDMDCQGEIYSIPNILPGLCPDHTIDNSFAWSDSVGWIDLHGVHIPINIPQVVDVTIGILPDPTCDDKATAPTSNNTDDYKITITMTEIETGEVIPQEDHTFFIAPTWIDSVRYDQITDNAPVEDHSSDNNGPVNKPFSATDFSWDSDAELFYVPVTSAAPTSNLNYYTFGFSNERFMLPDAMADITLNPNELFMVNAEIAIYDTVAEQCIYPYSYTTGMDEATCFANPVLDVPPGYEAPNGTELCFAPAVDLTEFNNLSADDTGTIAARYTVADQISMEKSCTLADCSIATIDLIQEVGVGGFTFDPLTPQYVPDITFPAEHLYTPLCNTYDANDDPQCPLTGEDASMYSIVRYTLGSAATQYYSAKLPRVFGTVVVNPVAEIFGNVYSTGVTNPQTGQTVRSLGDVSTNILRDTIVKNVAAIVAGVAVDDAAGNVTVTADGTKFNISAGSGATLLPDSAGNPRVLYFRNKNVYLSDATDAVTWTGKRTIIVEGGSVFIDSNLYNGVGAIDKLGIIVLKDYASDYKGEQGHVYIAPSVTDIQANIFADGSVFSYDGDPTNIVPLTGEPIFLSESDRSTTLLNQLFITGSIASKNTIGGAVKTPEPILGDGRRVTAAEGEYGLNPSGRSQARLYDMNFLRYYGFVFERDPDTGHAIDQQLKLIDPDTAGDPDTPGYSILAEPSPEYGGTNPDGDLVIVTGGTQSDQADDDTQFSAVYVKFDPPPADLPGFGVSVGADVTIRGQ